MFRQINFLSKTTNAFGLFSNRNLYDFRTARPEVVIGNNTAIFVTLSTLRKHGNARHPNITFICPEFWLDNIHEDYKSLSWGQTIYGLPKFAREMFLQIYPNYPEDKRITWQEYQELRQAAIHELKNQDNIRFIHGMPEIINPNESGFEVCINSSIKKLNIILPSNSFFYNWTKTYIKHNLPGIIQKPHTQLYTVARNKLPQTIVVLGHGVSVDWLVDHFPEIDIINIKYANDKRVIIPANKHINFDRVLILNTSDIVVRANEINPNKVYVTLNHDPHSTYQGEFYNAIGVSDTREITSKLSTDNKEDFSLTYKLENWKAPKNIPNGSLIESFSRWIEQTNNLSWAHEPQAYHSDHFPKFLLEKMKHKDIELSPTFFGLLEDNIKKLADPLNDHTNLFVEVFKKSMNVVSEDQIANFKQCLNEINKEREFEYRINESIQNRR